MSASYQALRSEAGSLEGSDASSSAATSARGRSPGGLLRGSHKVPLNFDEKPLHARPRKWWNRTRQLFFEKRRRYGWADWLGEVLPCMAWLRTYDVRALLPSDFMAGLSVACMEIPQGMSYASLAGLPIVFGLYGATIPCIIFCLFGSSRQLAVGPVAVTSMLLGSGLTEAFGGRVNENPNAPADPELQAQYNQAAVQVAFLVGLLYSAVGLLRLGWLTNFLSHSVISGFTSGAAIIISMSQVKYLLGLRLPRADRLQEGLRLILQNLHAISLAELFMGLSFISILVCFRVLAARHKRLVFLRAIGPITVSGLSIALVWLFGLDALPSRERPYIHAVGPMPKGLPGFTAGWWLPLRFPGAQLTLAVLVCLIDAVEAMSIAKSLAVTNGYELDATQDLRALGFANLAGSAFNCYNTTGSFSRSAVNNEVGAKTPLASGICGLLLMFTLLYITPLFTHMSKNAQAAIIIVGVLGLLDWRECVFLYQVNTPDWVVWMAAFLFTMFAGVEAGIGVSVGLALVLVIYRSAFPRIATLGRLPDTNPGLYRNRKMYPITLEEPGMLLLRIDAPIYFANVQPVKEGIRKAVKKSRQQQDVQFVILDFSPVTDIDATAVHFLDAFLDELKREGLQLALANPSQQVVTLLRRSNVLSKIGESNIHVNMSDAVELSRLTLAVAAHEAMLATLPGGGSGGGIGTGGEGSGCEA